MLSSHERHDRRELRWTGQRLDRLDGKDLSAVGSRGSDARAQKLGSDAGLPPREAEILALIAKRLSNQQIASRLYLSLNSIKTYIRTGYRKIGVESRAEAVG